MASVRRLFAVLALASTRGLSIMPDKASPLAPAAHALLQGSEDMTDGPDMPLDVTSEAGKGPAPSSSRLPAGQSDDDDDSTATGDDDDDDDDDDDSSSDDDDADEGDDEDETAEDDDDDDDTSSRAKPESKTSLGRRSGVADGKNSKGDGKEASLMPTLPDGGDVSTTLSASTSKLLLAFLDTTVNKLLQECGTGAGAFTPLKITSSFVKAVNIKDRVLDLKVRYKGADGSEGEGGFSIEECIGKGCAELYEVVGVEPLSLLPSCVQKRVADDTAAAQRADATGANADEKAAFERESLKALRGHADPRQAKGGPQVPPAKSILGGIADWLGVGAARQEFEAAQAAGQQATQQLRELEAMRAAQLQAEAQPGLRPDAGAADAAAADGAPAKKKRGKEQSKERQLATQQVRAAAANSGRPDDKKVGAASGQPRKARGGGHGAAYSLGHVPFPAGHNYSALLPPVREASASALLPANFNSMEGTECLVGFPRRDQGGCGASYAFAASTALSLQYCRARGQCAPEPHHAWRTCPCIPRAARR